MRRTTIQDASRAFFDTRAAQVRELDLAALCYVSGRDPRLWSDERIYGDMVDSILSLTKANGHSTLLEVGCASGFVARGVAPRVGAYVGVDVAARAVAMAKRLNLGNAEFRVGDGTKLPFTKDRFDAAICYDVFTNFPDFALGEAIIRDMLRVVKPGGNVLIGSIPDGARQAEYERRTVEVARELEARYGPAPSVQAEQRLGPLERIWRWLRRVEPGIVCYYFRREDFVNLAERAGAEVRIADIHPLNPYLGFRFNAVYTKKSP